MQEKKGVTWGIERGSDLGKSQALRAALIHHDGFRYLPLVFPCLFNIVHALPMRKHMRHAHLLGQYQQKR